MSPVLDRKVTSYLSKTCEREEKMSDTYEEIIDRQDIFLQFIRSQELSSELKTRVREAEGKGVAIC